MLKDDDHDIRIPGMEKVEEFFVNFVVDFVGGGFVRVE